LLERARTAVEMGRTLFMSERLKAANPKYHNSIEDKHVKGEFKRTGREVTSRSETKKGPERQEQHLTINLLDGSHSYEQMITGRWIRWRSVVQQSRTELV
ncbi:unnamed protein product, partial [Ceratitis capitata]